MEGGAEIEGDDLVPFRDRKFLDWADELHSGIVDEDVDTARLRHHLFDLRHIGEVRARMGCAQFLTQARDLVRIAEAVQDDIGPLLLQSPCNGEADTAGRPRYKRALAFEEIGLKHFGLRAFEADIPRLRRGGRRGQ